MSVEPIALRGTELSGKAGTEVEAARPGKRGRPPVDDRACLTGIIFVLQSGIPWEMLPQEMGCGCGMTCWRRLAEWTAAGVWPRLHALLLAEPEYAGRIDWSRAAGAS